MSESMNITNTEISKAASSNHTSPAVAGVEKVTNQEMSESEQNTDSFKSSLSKVTEESSTEKESLDKDESGNDLPVLEDMEAKVARDDRHILEQAVIPGIKLVADNSIKQNVTSTQKLDTAVADSDTRMSANDRLASQTGMVQTQSAATDNAKPELLSSPVRQLLQVEQKLNIDEKSVLKTSIPSHSLETANTKQSEIPVLKMDTLDQAFNKNMMTAQATTRNILDMPVQSPSAASDMQSSILTRTAHSVDTTINILPTPVNSTSTPLQSSPMQAFTSAMINEQVGQPGWSQGMAKQVVWMANQNIKSAEIRLNPAHLGPLEVKLDINDDQINVALSSRHASVREAMEVALPRLREMLDENGLNLSDADITEHGFSDQREHASDNVGINPFSASQDDNETMQIDSRLVQQVAIPDSMVDYYI